MTVNKNVYLVRKVNDKFLLKMSTKITKKLPLCIYCCLLFLSLDSLKYNTKRGVLTADSQILAAVGRLKSGACQRRTPPTCSPQWCIVVDVAGFQIPWAGRRRCAG